MYPFLCIINYLINIHKLFSIRCYSTTSDHVLNRSIIHLIFSYHTYIPL